MQRIPAIDIQGGSCVQLIGGNPEALTVSLNNPEARVQEFVSHGAGRVHLVDLDRAFQTGDNNFELVKLILGAKGSEQVQVGGGIRSLEDIEQLLEAGADRVITGTKALEDPKWFYEAVQNFGGRLMVSLDANKEGDLVKKGWKEFAGLNIFQAILMFREQGISGIIYTDKDKDGSQQGPNLGMIREIAELLDDYDLELLVSGGVGSLEDIKEVERIEGVDGLIIGTAAYTGALTVRDVFGLNGTGDV